MPSCHLKSEARADFVEELDRLEKQSDLCYQPLALLREPRNRAAWAVLTVCTEVLENTINQQGPDSIRFQAAGINLARSASLLIDWIQQHGIDHGVPASRFQWNTRLAGDARSALEVARSYDVFRSCFPAWHKYRELAEIVAPQRVRFTAVGGADARRVSAFQKGFRANRGSKVAPVSTVPITPELTDQLANVVARARQRGPLGFTYGEPMEIYTYLAAIYLAKLDLQFRRLESLSLGPYTLRDLKLFHSALLGICSVHDYLCFHWGQPPGKYPINSAVLVKTRRRWLDLVGAVSSLSGKTVDAILEDLTLPSEKSKKLLDLHVHPFVSLGANSALLGLAPQFAIKSNAEENMLRICSYREEWAFGEISKSKEDEQRQDLISTCSRFRCHGPINLPKGLPDLDFIVEDRGSSTLVIAELKWIRKTVHFFERLERDKEVHKGLGQLEDMARFLGANPTYLKDRGVVSKSLSDFANMHYLLIARDHFVWVDPSKDYPILEHESFKETVGRTSDLQSAVSEMLRFEWLPLEGRDFVVRNESAVANGVVIESEVFHAPPDFTPGG